MAQPPTRDKAEELVRKMEAVFLVDPSGFFPYFDSVYQGGGLTGGAGYRKFYGDNTFWEVKGLYSVLNYKLIEAGTVSKDHLNGRLLFGTRFGWRDATQVGYFGIGQNSKEEDMARFRFQETYVEGRAEYRPLRWLPIKSSLAFENWNTLQGQGSDPSIETLYTPATAPGLGSEPSYVHTNVSAGMDWRQSPGYTRRGGLYAGEIPRLSGYQRWTVQLPEAGRGGHPARSVASRDLGARRTRQGRDYIKRQCRDPILHAAVSREWKYSSSLLQLPLPGPAQHAYECRIPMDPSRRSGYGALLRCRKGYKPAWETSISKDSRVMSGSVRGSMDHWQRR